MVGVCCSLFLSFSSCVVRCLVFGVVSCSLCDVVWLLLFVCSLLSFVVC